MRRTRSLLIARKDKCDLSAKTKSELYERNLTSSVIWNFTAHKNLSREIKNIFAKVKNIHRHGGGKIF